MIFSHRNETHSHKQTASLRMSVGRSFAPAVILSRVGTAKAIALVTLNRPHRRNAVDRVTAAELKAAFKSFDDDKTLNVAILYGAGGNFCAGADLQSMESDPMNLDELGPMGPTGLLLSKPVIAAVEGYAVAGGLELACWCDLRVGQADSIFGVFCRRFGVPLIDGGTVRLPRLIGQSHALDMILTGREVKSEEALRIGLLNRLAPAGSTALEEAMKLAEDISRHPQQCMRNDRLSALSQWNQPTLKAALEEERRLGLETVSSGETFQGARKFSSGSGRHGSKL
jgi:enoyl-CoA hydratase